MKSWVKIPIYSIGALALLYGVLVAALALAMRQPPAVFTKFMARVPRPAMMILPFQPLWQWARAGRLNPGDSAPDFFLPTVDQKGMVRLSDFRGKRPVVLIFGSYT